MRSREQIAIFCGLSAQQFWAMTPREVEWRIQADVEREDREFERLAQLACWVMNQWQPKGKALTVKDLLRKRPTKKRT